MKTLIITLEYPPQIGGIASYTYNLAKHLPAEEVIVYAPKIAGAPEIDKKNPWKTVRAKPYIFFWPRWMKMLWDVWRLIKKENIGQIYVHHVLPVGYVAYLMSKMKKIPYTVFFHGTDLMVALKNKKNKLKKVCYGAQKLVFNSNFLKNIFIQNFENYTQEMLVIHPCPDEIFFKPAADAELKKLKSKLALEGKKVIITAARMSDGKGYPHLIRLLPKILETVPNLVWLIVGDGPKKNEIITAIQKNFLQNVTRFIGQVPYTELPKYYQMADALVLLTHPDESSVQEAWGTAFIEAAASGLPSIAGRAGGVEEAVQDLETGLIVDVYKDQGIITAISELMKQGAYAKKMGQVGRERALAEFTWEKQLQKLEERSSKLE